MIEAYVDSLKDIGERYYDVYVEKFGNEDVEYQVSKFKHIRSYADRSEAKDAVKNINKAIKIFKKENVPERKIWKFIEVLSEQEGLLMQGDIKKALSKTLKYFREVYGIKSKRATA